MFKVTYVADHQPPITILHDPQHTLLQTSLNHQLAHYHLCGGRGRCTTCRVRVIEGETALAERNLVEQYVADLKKWPATLRLACQTHIHGDVVLKRLVVDEGSETGTLNNNEARISAGFERELAVMFCDIVGFTQFAACHLPYDVVHLLNRYYRDMGDIILQYGGHIDKYMGDGMLVLFGLEEQDSNAETICHTAVQAAQGMLAQLDSLNQYIRPLFDHAFNMRIGIHFGSVIVGKIGHPQHRQLTVLGDTVNIASRIEAANKEYKTTLLVSAEVAQHLPAQCSTQHIATTQLRGQYRQHDLYQVLPATV